MLFLPQKIKYLCKYFTTIIFLLPFFVSAQLNYNFNAYTDPFILNSSGSPVTLSNFWTSGSVTDDGYMNNVPIGFSFNFNGKSYSTIHITTNGMAALGDTFTTGSSFKNSLLVGDGIASTRRAYLAPLWSDLDIVSTSNLTYQLSGIAPTRVFTVEWNNVQWYGISSRRASFQIQLHETNNDIRFAYKQETGSSVGRIASVGITDTVTGPDYFIALQNVSANPTISTVFENRITEIPATNQVYVFSLAPCILPNLKLEGFTNKKITVTNSAISSGGFEYIVNTNIITPSSGVISNQSTVTVSSLNPSTQYYFHCRNICDSGTKGKWKTFSFKTAVDTALLPYNQNFNATTQQYAMPNEMRTIQRDSTSWVNLAKAQYNNNPYYSNGDTYYSYSWFYLPPLHFNNSYTYNLKFKYRGFSNGDMIFVKYGHEMDSSTTTGVTIANSTTPAGYKDTSFLIQPAQTGSYYIGFRAYSRDTTIEIDNINVSIDSNLLPVKFISLKGIRVNKKNVINWIVTSELNTEGYHIQRSIDGNNFKNIAFVTANKNVETSKYSYTDEEVLSKKYYYRIEEKDKDGKTTISSVITINDGEIKKLNLFPNPVVNTLYLSLDGLNEKRYTYTITDIAGRILIRKPISLEESNSAKIETTNLPNGTYIFQLKGRNELLKDAFLIQK